MHHGKFIADDLRAHAAALSLDSGQEALAAVRAYDPKPFFGESTLHHETGTASWFFMTIVEES